MAGDILPRRWALHCAHRPGEEAEAVGDGGDFVVQHPDPGLAAVERFQRGEGLRVALDGVGELEQQC